MKPFESLIRGLRQLLWRRTNLNHVVEWTGFPSDAPHDPHWQGDQQLLQQLTDAIDRIEVFRVWRPLNHHQQTFCQFERFVPEAVQIEMAEEMGRGMLASGAFVVGWGKRTGGEVVAKGEISVLRPAGDKHVLSREMQAAEDDALERAALVLDQRATDAADVALRHDLTDRGKRWSDLAKGYRAAAAEIRALKSQAPTDAPALEVAS